MSAASSPNRTTTLTLPSAEQILITREFDAPRHLVYRAFTTAELIERWWHANRGAVTEVSIDLRVGGRWRYAMTAENGMEVAFYGEYREVVPDERLVTTEIYEGLPAGIREEDAATVNTVTLADRDGGTLLTLLIQAPSQAARDAIIASGMEAGLQDAMNLLEEVSLGLS